MIGLGALMGGIETLSGGSDTTSQMTPSSMADRSPVNVATTGVNLGAMLAPYTQGSPANGGYGTDFLQRYATDGNSGLSAVFTPGSSMLPWILSGVGILGLTVFLIKRRG